MGEAPVGYGYVDLTDAELSYTISGLSPGIAYTVYVSALNRHGQGARAAMSTGGVMLPLTVPSAPTNVTVETKGWSETEDDGMGDSQVKLSHRHQHQLQHPRVKKSARGRGIRSQSNVFFYMRNVT